MFSPSCSLWVPARFRHQIRMIIFSFKAMRLVMGRSKIQPSVLTVSCSISGSVSRMWANKILQYFYNTIDSPEHIFVHLGRTMDEDDPELSQALGKLPGEDKANVPQSWRSVKRTIMSFHTVGDISPHLTPYKDVTYSEMILLLRQNQRLERRRKRLYIPILETWQRGTQTLVHSDWYSNIAILILAILTLASEVLWQISHWWSIFLPFTIYFLRVRLV